MEFPIWIYYLSGIIVSFTISWFAIPLVHATAWINGLFAGLNGRTSHTHPIPLFGGVAIFVSFCLTTITIGASSFDGKFIYAMAGMMIMFIVGIKDDLTITRPKKKLLGQLLAIFYIVVLGDIRINSLYGFMSIGALPYLISIFLTVFVMLVITNGFNLIDGIDGLASGTGILISVILGIWFHVAGDTHYCIMCCSLAGSTLAFFYYNVFSRKKKLFLGDGGSLILGLILGVMVVRFLQTEPELSGIAEINSTPAFAISLFALPLFDTLRVFTIRISQGKSPFEADRQHLHHYLLALGFSHLKATLILLSCNLILIIMSYWLQDLGTFSLTIILLALSIFFSQILVYKVKHLKSKAKMELSHNTETEIVMSTLVVSENELK